MCQTAQALYPSGFSYLQRDASPKVTSFPEIVHI